MPMAEIRKHRKEVPQEMLKVQQKQINRGQMNYSIN